MESSESDSIFLTTHGTQYDGFFPDEGYGMDYEKTVMCGHYDKRVAQYQEHLIRLKQHQKQEHKAGTFLGSRKLALALKWIWCHTFCHFEDWAFLFMLGIIMALLSFTVTQLISWVNMARIQLFYYYENQTIQYFLWVTLPVILIIFSAEFVHMTAPQSIGSGIPEMKTILRGIHLQNYLTTNALIAKIVGLVGVLGSGMPLGKEGPFVHNACIIATKLNKLGPKDCNGIYDNETRHYEKLSAASAVGVASCYGTPIGGVLFSIEVTAIYFAVRNYWRAFFSAAICSTFLRLLAVWFTGGKTLTGQFQTYIDEYTPFAPYELIIFSFLGVICGLGGAFYVWLHRNYVLFARRKLRMGGFLHRHRLLYPTVVGFLISSITCPLTLGPWIAGELNTMGHVSRLFLNFSYCEENLTISQQNSLKPFIKYYQNQNDIFITLLAFIFYTFIFSIIAGTLPVPSGSFIPGFKIGAAIGRLIGEVTYLVIARDIDAPIIPGGYAIAGAAAFAGAITHSFSVSVIMIEITGQITHIIPMMLTILIANSVAICLQPSLYDSIIMLKKLPFIPDISASVRQETYNIYVEDFMVKDVVYIWKGMTYGELKTILHKTLNLHSYPLVDSPNTQILLGSIHRVALINLIDRRIGRKVRLKVVAERKSEWKRKMLQIEKKWKFKKAKRQNRFQVVPVLQDNLIPSPGVSRTHSDKLIESISSKEVFKRGAYATITGAEFSNDEEKETRIRLAIEAINLRRGSIAKSDETIKQPDDVTSLSTNTILSDSSMSSLERLHLKSENTEWVYVGNELPPTQPDKKQLTVTPQIAHDMSVSEQKQWECEQLAVPVDFALCKVDPAPFQLVERTSLLKVHSLFSMVGIYHAYVTATGRLIGVVALKELCKAIEDANRGRLKVHQNDEI